MAVRKARLEGRRLKPAAPTGAQTGSFPLLIEQPAETAQLAMTLLIVHAPDTQSVCRQGVVLPIVVREFQRDDGDCYSP
jgi:hypothetical protein